jgi:cytochrome c-type biogenesis protein CcmI
MLLWVIFALMTSVVLIAVLAPLSRPATRGADAGTGALEVYRDQLAEVEAERARGLVETAEADAARLEISRRLLASGAGRGRRRAHARAPHTACHYRRNSRHAVQHGFTSPTANPTCRLPADRHRRSPMHP